MTCNSNNKSNCGCNFRLGCHGLCDTSTIHINGRDRTQLNWNEISVPEILPVPDPKPNIEHLDQVYVNGKINCAKLIETPFAYKEYDRLVTQDIADVIDQALLLATVDISLVVNSVAAILAVPGLGGVPGVGIYLTALQAALDAVEIAAAALSVAITNAVAVMGANCLLAALVTAAIEAVILAIEALIAAITLLNNAANALLAFVLNIAIIGPATQIVVDALLAATQAVLDPIEDALTELQQALLDIGLAKVMVIIPNEEGTYLTGRKIVVDGTLDQKVVYTGLVERQSVHSFCSEIPFTAYIIPYAKFVGLNYEEDIVVITDPKTCETGIVNGFLFDPNEPIEVDVCEEFNVTMCIEDIFAHALDQRTVFKNITVFLQALPATQCR